jgi:hypothetical protein
MSRLRRGTATLYEEKLPRSGFVQRNIIGSGSVDPMDAARQSALGGETGCSSRTTLARA